MNMRGKKIDTSLCNACGECIRICHESRVLVRGPDGFPRYDRDERCILCGHCLAICPRGAITFTTDGRTDRDAYCAEARPVGGTAALEPALELLFSLRSTRFFNGGAVERDKLSLVLEAMVRAPSAGNEQNRSFYIYDGKHKVDALDADTREHYRKSTARMAGPATRAIAARLMAAKDLSGVTMRNRLIADLPRKERESAYARLFDDLASLYADGDFRLFHGAAAAILVTSHTNTTDFHKPFHRADVEIAVTYGTLAAASLGLASCRLGLSVMAFGADRKLREKHGIPETSAWTGFLPSGTPTSSGSASPRADR
jgi:ferredoxin